MSSRCLRAPICRAFARRERPLGLVTALAACERIGSEFSRARPRIAAAFAGPDQRRLGHEFVSRLSRRRREARPSAKFAEEGAARLAAGEHEPYLASAASAHGGRRYPTCRSSPPAWSGAAGMGRGALRGLPGRRDEIAAATITRLRHARGRADRPRRQRVRLARRARRDARRGDANSRRPAARAAGRRRVRSSGHAFEMGARRGGRIVDFETFMTGEVFAA